MSEEKNVAAAAVSRDRIIVRTSMLGIAANLLLAGFKAATGLMAHSIAVVLDAVNNLSDALSSVVTIIGAKIAGRKPDKNHPLGHGRVEYLSAMIVSALVLYTGVTSLVESIKKIIRPETPDYSAVTLIVVASAVVIKLLLGQYVKRQGKKAKSASLTASGADALFDAILSVSVLLSALIFMIWHVSLEAYVGILISAFIIKSGVGMLRETFDDFLGKRVDRDFLAAVRSTICEEPLVRGAFDLILHSYGPERYVGSVHVEVPDTLNASEIDAMERRIADNVYRKHGILMTGIGIYTFNTTDDAADSLRREIMRIAESHDGVLQLHGFFADLETKTIRMDVILDFELEDRQKTFDDVRRDLQKAFPEYTFVLTLDLDY